MEIQVELNAKACIFLALLFLMLPLNWLLAALLAALVHELCHIIAVMAAGGIIRSAHIGASGAVLEVTFATPWQEVLCSFAGPAGSLILSAFAAYIPRTSVCALVQGIYNLMPIYPLDGGRMLRALASMLLSGLAAERLCRWMEGLVLILISIGGIWGTFFLQLGLLPIATALFFLGRVLSGKIPCKEGNLGVQ